MGQTDGVRKVTVTPPLPPAPHACDGGNKWTLSKRVGRIRWGKASVD